MIGTFFDLPGHNADTLNSILDYEWENVKGNTPEEISDVFDEENNVQFYVNQNDFNKSFEVLAALPEEPKEGLKEKAAQVQDIASEVIKEHINNRMETGRIAKKTDIPNATLEDLNQLINTIWDEASQDIEQEELSSIFDQQTVGWEVKFDKRRNLYYLDYVEYAPIDAQTRDMAIRITEIMKNYIEREVLQMQTIVGEDRFFHGTNEYKLNSLLDQNWEKIVQLGIKRGIPEEFFSKAGWSIVHDDQYRYYYVDFEPYGKVDADGEKQLHKISALTAKAIKKIYKKTR